MTPIVYRKPPRNSGPAHALELIQQLGGAAGVLLDVGAGLSSVVERVTALGLRYLAIAADASSCAALRAQGVECAQADFSDARQLRECAGGDSIAAVSLIGVLDQLSEDSEVLSSLRTLCAGAAIPLVVDANNALSSERLLSLIAGTGGQRAARYSASALDTIMSESGWREAARSDQDSNPDGEAHRRSVVLSTHSLLNQFFRKIHQGAEESANVSRFVRAYLPAQRKSTSLPAEAARPFLSIVMRTQGRRPGTLRDVLLALAAQSCDDFEVVLLPHKVDAAQWTAIEEIVAEQPEPLRERIRLVRVEHGGRTTPLNVGFAESRGEYISILDDDDMVFCHWVETFRKGAAVAAGTLLRAVAVEQEIESREWSNGVAGYRTMSGFKKTFPADYDLYAHLTQNVSPPVCLAFPAAFFHELGQRFDEALNTCEDWDYEMRCALTCGVTALREYTAIYRKWKTGASSYTVHPLEEWQENDRRIVSRLNGQPHLFPAGTVDVLRRQQAWIRALEQQNAELQAQLHGGAPAQRPPVPPPGTDRPVRYDVADEINRVMKRLPAVHPLLKASLRKLTR